MKGRVREVFSRENTEFIQSTAEFIELSLRRISRRITQDFG